MGSELATLADCTPLHASMAASCAGLSNSNLVMPGIQIGPGAMPVRYIFRKVFGLTPQWDAASLRFISRLAGCVLMWFSLV